MEHLSLLAGGQEHTVADWEREAAAVLRKAGRLGAEDPDSAVWEKLTRTTLDGIRVTPLGTPGEFRADSYTRGTSLDRGDLGWDIRAHLGDPDAGLAAEAAVADLENGVTSLWLTVGRGGIAIADLRAVLEKVYLDLAPVVLDADQPVAAAEAFLALLGERGLTAAPGSNLGADPIGRALRGGGRSVDVAPTVDLARIVELAQGAGTRAMVVDATALHDAWATDAQELGYSLAVGVTYLRQLVATGLDVATAASLIEFRYAATVEQFPTIAKLRAARRLWQRVLELSSVPGAPAQVQHAVTSRQMMTKHDPWVNMLRGTVAAFAAGAGGAASVTVLPFDTALGLPDAFSRRIARNTSSLLIHEAHVARVTDPAGGSYAVEQLTDDLSAAGWAQFCELEAEGGVVASLAKERGGLLDRVEEQGKLPRLQQIRTRKRPITGLTEFPNLGEVLPDRRPHPEHAPSADGYGIEFEALRDQPVATPVLLATMGSVAAHTARATFAHNLLAAGGVETVSTGPSESGADLVAAYQGQPVVCLCGTDAAYAGWGAEAIAALREAGASYLILAGKPGAGIVVDDSAAMGIDALAFLTRVREELGT